MKSQSGQQIIAMLYVSRGTGNQIMKLGQLMEYNMRNIFLEKSYTKWGREASRRPFDKKPKMEISLDQESEML